MAEGENCAGGLVGKRACDDPGDLAEFGGRDIMAGEEPDLDHPRKPEGSDEVGQLGAF